MTESSSTRPTEARVPQQAKARAGMPFTRRGVLFGLVALVMAFASPAAHAQKNKAVELVPVIERIVVQDGVLMAVGRLGAGTFAQPINLGLAKDQKERRGNQGQGQGQGRSCPILDLELGPINLNLLGLNVQTSAICLTIDAERGRGKLLGNLLCGIAHLLDRGLTLDQILIGLNRNQLQTLTAGLTDLLNGAISRSVISAKAVETQVNGRTVCDILNLTLGPVDLNLLGLDVELDNCADGPITVDIFATPTGLLGDLLCNLADLLDGRTLLDILNDRALLSDAQKLLGLIGGILGGTVG